MIKFSTSKLRYGEFYVVVFIVIFVVAMAGASMVAGSDEVLSHLGKIELTVFIGLLLLSLLNYFVRALRWHIFSEHMDLEIPIHRNTLYYFAGFSMTTTPGKLGEALRLWFMERCHNHKYVKVAPLFLGDRLSDMNAMLILIAVGIVSFSSHILSVLVAVIILATISILFVNPRPLIKILGTIHVAMGRRKSRLFVKLRQILRLTPQLFSPKIFTITLLLAIFGWLAECVAFYWLLSELNVEISFTQAMFIFCFAMIAGAISMLPGGLGGVEAVMLSLLVAIGADMEEGIAATAIIRLTTLWFAVAIGFILLPITLRIVKKSKISCT